MRDLNQSVDQLFKHLLGNRCFPKYQLERRLDIFISYFLEDFFSDPNHFGTKVKMVAPEFPIKNEGDNNYSSKNIDYLLSLLSR